MAGRHGNKGVISEIMPVEDMPYDEKGNPVRTKYSIIALGNLDTHPCKKTVILGSLYIFPKVIKWRDS